VTRGRCTLDKDWQRLVGQRLGWILALATVFGVLSAWGGTRANGFLQVLDDMQKAYARVDHYTANFLVQERLNGELRPEHRIELKFRKPFHVYMRWVEGPNEGRQALYPAGSDGNELWVRVPLLVGAVTVRLDPDSPRARKGNRHPITDIGIGRILDLLVDNVQRGTREAAVTVEYTGPRTTLDRPAQRYILHLPNDQSQGYYCKTAVVDIDRDHRLPIYIEIFDWDNQLVERYGYRDLRLNPGLTDEDFDPKNPAYGF
jgi:outer membrane lipoprotein-sorting protein